MWSSTQFLRYINYRYFSLVLVKYILDGSLEVGCPKKSNSIQFDFFWKVNAHVDIALYRVYTYQEILDFLLYFD